MDIPSPYPGKVTEILIKKGDTINEGDDLCEIDVDLSHQPESEDPETIDDTTGTEVATEEQPESRKIIKDTPASEAPNVFLNKSFTGVHASPSVRKLARELGVDLTQVIGSGLKNRIQPEDLKSHVKAILTGATSSPGATLPEIPSIDHAKFGSIKSVPLSRIKKISGPRLQASWINIPHVTQHDEIDINELEQIRLDLKDKAKAEGFSLTILAFMVKAVCKILKDFPDFNSSLDPDGENLIQKDYINIGFAANTDKGLMVPVIKDADTLSISGLAKKLNDLTTKAREGHLAMEDVQGGTFTVNNTGALGTTSSIPLVNYPQAGIMTTEAIIKRPVVIDDAIAIRSMMNICLSFDHRIMDCLLYTSPSPRDRG